MKDIPVIGINIRSIEANREEQLEGNLQVNNSPRIVDVEEKSVGSLGKDALSIDFEYTCSYDEEDGDDSVAEIVMGGEVLFMTENPGEVVENWEEDQQLPNEVTVPVINSVMRKCLTRSIDLSEELQLPPPLRFPRAKEQSDNARYIS
ncbi:MAG: hypothetical protein ABEJ72_04670 [Candidatus Aenigmatarchaeota archaeon]